MDLESKVAKESNSGVFLRSGDTTKVLEALEVQVHESQGQASVWYRSIRIKELK
ncbi:MAG: hypothetical protein ACJ07L_12200 [Opitutales bacterium]